MTALGTVESYATRLARVLSETDWRMIEPLAEALIRIWQSGNQIFLCGNGGSAGNANHMANDFLYPVAKRLGSGIRAQALSANPAIVTCFGNDLGYDQIFAGQLRVMAAPGDLLMVFSGSGNSPNILRALEAAKEIGVTSFAILGFDGGKAKALADHPIHFAVDDMQISEDLQTITCHAVVQYLYSRREEFA